MGGGGTFSSGLSLAEPGSGLRGERRARNISLERLARLSGVSQSMVSEVERGAKTPSVLVLDRLATALGTPRPAGHRIRVHAHHPGTGRGRGRVLTARAGIA
ncbi:helix-turn-helix domain-containing protein [Streptomyces sp. NPDC005930]|uniref:helix-turn-helix domain-containing protein n=1 Tax=Streptomyces sp. NPDC005930 TaxID=3364736 RepID=UPI0036C6B8A3